MRGRRCQRSIMDFVRLYYAGHDIPFPCYTGCCSNSEYYYHYYLVCMCLLDELLFIRSEWKMFSSPGVWLLYRILMAVTAILLFVITLQGTEVDQRPWNDVRYFIYLTNWGMILLVITLMVEALIVFLNRSHLRETDSREEFVCVPLIVLTWILININSSAAIGISLIYWTTLYDGSPLDAVNVITHILNTVIVLVDLWLIAVPIRWGHFYQPVLFGISYLFFTLFYWLLGGTNYEDESSIYPILNWEKPFKTVLMFGFGGFFVITIMHFFVYFIASIRKNIAKIMYE